MSRLANPRIWIGPAIIIVIALILMWRGDKTTAPRDDPASRGEPVVSEPDAPLPVDTSFSAPTPPAEPDRPSLVEQARAPLAPVEMVLPASANNARVNLGKIDEAINKQNRALEEIKP